jgi:hypothetical protein
MIAIYKYRRRANAMYEIEIILHTDEEPTVQDVLDYINELGEDLDFTIKVSDTQGE